MFALLCLVLCAPARAGAQEDLDPTAAGRFRAGPIRFTPGIALTNIGVDNNVFNSALDPRQDVTAGIGPTVLWWTRLGRARLSGADSGVYLYFKTFDNQRAWNTSHQVKIELPLSRVQPFVDGSYINTRDRPGFEIDSRSRALVTGLTLGTGLRLSGKTSLVVSGMRSATTFDESETFLGAELAQALNRRSVAEQLQFRYALTPLTTFVVKTDAIQDRFSFGEERDADSIRVLPGFELKPLALISGKAYVGYRSFNAHSASTPDYRGPVAEILVESTLRATRIGVRVSRDLAFSFDNTQPYYALTDLGLSVEQRLGRVWDVRVSTGHQTLAYQNLTNQPGAAAKTERGSQYAVGAGYRLGRTARLGFDVSYARRQASSFAREFSGLRTGASVSYGFSQ